MAQINLKTGETQGSPQFPLGTNNDIVDAPGASGEKIYVAAGTQNFGATFNDGGDTIVLTGAPNQFTVSRAGGTITITNGSLTVTFPAPDPSLTAAQLPKFQFTNNTLGENDDTTFVLQRTGTGVTFTNTAAGSTPITVDTAPINVGTGTPGQPGGAASVTVTSTDVEEGGQITYTFTLSSAQTSAVTLSVATVGGTATRGADYTAVSQQITFAPGETVKFLTVQTIDDVQPEGSETIQLQVNVGNGVVLGAGSNLTAIILDANDGDRPRSFDLTTGNDTANGGTAADRFVGAQDINQPGKLLSANDVINGGGGTDTIEITNAPGGIPQVLADLDFTNVTNVENLVTNYASIQLGAQADKAGIVSVDTRTRTDAQNSQGIVFGGTQLDLTSDANGDNVPDFNNVLTIRMASSVADTVRLNLAASAGSTIDTGANFTLANGGGTLTPIDNIIVSGNTNPVRVTFTRANVGDGSSFDADGTTLAVQLQSEDANDGLTGGITRVDDEGLNLTGAQFDVRDGSGFQPGTFGQVILGTSGVENFTVGGNGGVYVNAGGGNDIVTGTAGVDFLVGGAGNDTLNGGGGADSILGGAGNDIINGGAGVDTLLDGGEGSDIYVFADGEFVANEAITDSGIGANDIDYLAITSSTPLTDAQFAGRTGIEGLATNVLNTPAVEVTIGTNAQTIGVRTVYGGDDDVTATTYTADLTVYSQGAVVTGSGNDTVVLQNQTAQQTTLVTLGHTTSSTGNFNYAGSVVLGAGNDTVVAGYALSTVTASTLTGGAGTDTLVLGGTSAGAQGGILPTNSDLTGGGAYTPNLTNVTGFEAITIAATAVGTSAASYTLNLADANVDAGTTLVINGSALRSGVVLAGPDGVAGTADDVTTNEVLTVNAGGLTGTRAVNVTGGASADVLNGGAGNDTLSGGLGDDLLNGGAGNDTLNGGAGDDQLTGGAGLDVLNGGEGSDTYNYADGELVAGETIADDGATGTDTIAVTSATALTDALFANKSGVEVLTTNVTVGTTGDLTAAGANAEVTIGALAQQAGIRTVNIGNDDLNAGGYTVGLTVNTISGSVLTGSGGDVVNVAPTTGPTVATISTGGGDDTVNINYMFVIAPGVLNGGTGTDTLTIGGPLNALTGAGYTGAANFPFTAGFTQFERLVIQAAEQAAAVAGGPDVAGSAPQFNVTFDDANVAAGVTFVVDASALGSSVTALGADGEIGGSGANADTTTFSTLTFNGAAEADGNFDVTGGAGNDVLTGGAGADFLRGGLGNDTINGGAGADTLEGGDGNDTLTGGAGFDTIRGGAGNDTIVLSVTEFNSDADTVDGGAGTDVLQINGTAAAQEIADVGFNGRFTSIEEVRLVGQAGGTAFTYNAGFYSQTAGVNLISLGANASGSTVSIASYTQGGPGNFPAPNVTLNDTLVTTNNAIFLGSGFNDTFNLGTTNTAAGGGDDVVRAAAGDDTINFGSTLTGTDIIDGGTGTDTLNVSGNGVVGTTFAQTINLQATVAAGVVTSGIFATDRVVLASGAAFTDNTAPTNDVAGSVSQYTVNVQDSTYDSATGTITIDGSALRSGVILTLAGGQSATTGEETLVVNAGAVTGSRAVNVTGGAANDTLTGGAGNDTLNGGGGADTINGGVGNDTIDGGAGNDILNGGDGNDTITGGAGSDTITGGLGADTINLGNDGARDTVIIGAGDAPRADPIGIETLNGFTFDSDPTAGLAAGADVIQFTYSNGTAAGIIDDNSPSITNGVVQQGSVLQNAINSSTSLLAAIQLIEQEFNADPLGDAEGVANANDGVVMFTYGGNTYIGVIEDTDPTAGITEAFTSIVQITGVGNVTQLIDADGAGPGTALGLSV